MKKKYDFVLFDLDGTLLDTSPGIYNSVRYAEAKMGFARISDDMLPSFVGPPPKTMYQKIYSVNESTALKAAKFHREYGREKAIYEAKVYPGIPDLLTSLKSSGYNLGVATLKSQSIAESVLTIHGLYSFFDCVVGMDSEETLTKQDTIRIAMDKVHSSKAILVGDSTYDFEGAVAAGIDFIGVLYGFGITQESKDYPTVAKPEELLEII